MPFKLNSKLTFAGSGVVHAADKALDALRRMRAGMRADKRTKKPIKEEVSTLFHRPRKVIKLDKKPAWKHKFFCLAYKDQARIPTTDFDKEELYLAELGEKEIEFPTLDASAEEFKEILLTSFPRLRQGGGYQLLKCMPNSRKLECLSSGVYSSPAALKQRVGSSRTYLRPIQRDLDIEPAEDSSDSGVSE